MNKVLGVALASAMFLSSGISTTAQPKSLWEPISPNIPNKEVILNYEATRPAYTPREFTYDEAQALMKVAEAEAGNQGVEGMVLVMAVVLNRVADNSGVFPDTIEGVIFQKGQFETVTNGRYDDIELSTNVHLALAKIETGEPFDTRIIGFETSANGKVLDKYFDYLYTVGDHDFYSAKK